MRVLGLTNAERFSQADILALESTGYRLAAFMSLDHAFELTQAALPNLLVLDNTALPSEQYALIALLRQDPITRHVPVICFGSMDSHLTSFTTDSLPDAFIEDVLNAESLRRVCEWFLARTGYLTQVLAGADERAILLAKDDKCEWTRSGMGIVGLVAIPDVAPEMVDSTLRDRCSHAYAKLDQLPEEKLSFEDLWNLLLLISVPYASNINHHPAQLEIKRTVLRFVRDTRGSRKVPLWKAESPLKYVGAVRPGPESWSPVSGDPLRDALNQAAYDTHEREALDVLFHRRISDDDLDLVIQVLGRRLSP